MKRNKISKKQQLQTQQLLNRAAELLNQKDFIAAEKLLQQILAIHPKHAIAYKFLALIAKELNYLDSAVSLFKVSISLNNKNADTYYNYAILLTELGHLNDAEQAYKNAVKLNKNMDTAWYNLADIYKRKHKHSQAIHAIQQIFKIPNHRSDMPNYIAKLYLDLGYIEESIEQCDLALTEKIQPDETTWILICCFQYSQDTNQLLSEIKRYQPATDPELMMRLTVSQAIAEWQLGLLSDCENSIELSKQWECSKGNPVNQSLHSYQIFINALLKHHKKHPNKRSTNRSIYLIGDSHCLSNANQTLHIDNHNYRAISKLIVGCKAFHLSLTYKNKFKVAFKRIIDETPNSSTIIMMIGEIDCRVNEGILPTFKKGHKELAELIHDTLSGYISFVLEHTQKKNIQIYFYGVPAPKLVLEATPEDMNLLKSIALLFNQTLQNLALDAGHKFIDIYGLTVKENGLSDGLYHIDDFHLLPKVIEAATIPRL